MAEFNKALEYALGSEGDWANDPDDHGGPTWRGLTLKLAQSYYPDLTEDTLRLIGQAEFESIFEREFWRFGNLNSQRVASKIFDMAVNMGLHQALMLLQGRLNIGGAGLAVDGRYGPRTEAAINANQEDWILAGLCQASRDFYTSLIAKDPSQAKYKGWFTRAAKLPK